MKVTVVRYTSRDRKVWEELYQENPKLSVYQSPSFVEKFLKTAKLGKQRITLRNEILLCTGDDFKMICPLAVNRHKKKCIC